MLIIGDVHGKVDQYWKLLQKHKPEWSMQIGDFGFKKPHDWFLENIDFMHHKIIFGNHDYMPYLHYPHSMQDVGYNWNEDHMTIRGAYSIDKAVRTEDVDWFADEEMTYDRWKKAITFYENNLPAAVISHECPQSVREQLFHISDKSITTNAMQQCFEIHQPELWIFGHYHQHKNEVINGTRFICLAELETFNLDI